VRVAAISDIHGNLPALEAVLAEVADEQVDSVVVPGDTISGPWAAEVFDRLDGMGAIFVRGNADDEVVHRSERFGQLAPWSADRLGASRLAAVAEWPLTVSLDVEDLGRVLVCHSTPSSDEPIYTRITPDAEIVELLGPIDADVVVSGHTHMQFDRTLGGGIRLVNAGSVGMPYEGARGAYWTLLGPDVEFHRTEYDVEACVAAIQVMGVPIPDGQLEQLLEPPDSTSVTDHFESLRGS
jgi:putative phosphoesterase